MKTPLYTILIFLFGVTCVAQELVGPDRIATGTLASFEVVPSQEASWNIVSTETSVESYKIDTDSSKLYFASPTAGNYTVVAGVVVDGKPILLLKTFVNGDEDVTPNPSPKPTPKPPVTSLEVWVQTQTPILVKSKNLVAESQLVAGCFEQIVQRIADQNIRTAQNARTQLQITLTASLAQASPTAVTDWMPFLAELSRQLEKELGDKIDDLSQVNKMLQTVCDAMKTIEMPKSTAPVKTTTRGVDCPNCRTPGTTGRTFRYLLSK